MSLTLYDVDAQRETSTEISLAGQYRSDVTEQFTNRLTSRAWSLVRSYAGGYFALPSNIGQHSCTGASRTRSISASPPA